MCLTDSDLQVVFPTFFLLLFFHISFCLQFPTETPEGIITFNIFIFKMDVDYRENREQKDRCLFDCLWNNNSDDRQFLFLECIYERAIIVLLPHLNSHNYFGKYQNYLNHIYARSQSFIQSFVRLSWSQTHRATPASVHTFTLTFTPLVNSPYYSCVYGFWAETESLIFWFQSRH